MAGRVVDITSEGLSLRLHRGFCQISSSCGSKQVIPLSDIDTVVVSATGAMVSTNLMAALAKNGSSVVVSGENYNPSLMLIPCKGHHVQGKRMRLQADSTKPVRKRLWAELVKAKILAQAEVLATVSRPTSRLANLATQVRSGDSSNREAIAAQYYWPTLLDSDFRRDRNAPGVNAMLNYGYTVLRSATARAIVAAGLHPSLSVHHVSDSDAFCLADDLMEPFRPAVDLIALELIRNDASIEEPKTKAKLVSVLQADYLTDNGRSPLQVVLVRLAQSLADVFEGSRTSLNFPKSKIPVIEEL